MTGRLPKPLAKKVLANPSMYLRRTLAAATAYANMRRYGLFRRGGAPGAGEPFDIVITFVNAADHEWLAAREAHRAAAETKLNPASRYFEFDSLRYCLRAINTYMSGYRRIHLVTSSARGLPEPSVDSVIRIVEHRDIFPDPTVLPTFNSIAIEACLGRIPGLAERFVYFNDDVLLTARVGPGEFFDAVGPRYTLCRRTTLLDHERASGGNSIAEKNAARMLSGRLGSGPRFLKLAHTPFPYHLRHWQAAEREYPEAFAANRAARFRSRNCIALANFLVPYLGLSWQEASIRGVDWMMRSDVPIYPALEQDVSVFAAALQRAVPFANINDSIIDGAAPAVTASVARALNAHLARVYATPADFES